MTAPPPLDLQYPETQSIAEDRMDTSSPTALAMYGAACRPHNGAARRTSLDAKGTPPLNKKKPENVDKAEPGSIGYTPEELMTLASLCGLGPPVSRKKQKQLNQKMEQMGKMQPRNKLQMIEPMAFSAPRKPQQSNKAAVQDVKMDETPRPANLNRNSASRTAPEKQSGTPLTDPVLSTDSHESRSHCSSYREFPPSGPECGTPFIKNKSRTLSPLWASSTKHEPEKNPASGTSVALPTTPTPYDYVPRHLRSKQEPGAPSPVATVATAPVSRSTKDPSAAAKPHRNHSLAKDVGRQESNTASRVNNSLFRDTVFGKNRCTKRHKYSQSDEDVFNLLEEQHVTAVNAKATTTSIQGGH
ncbi:hypothetical protein PG993_004970 [Apiospora rasikravindrae]|uniref:Uncharacterized protein n=1 Tax=Apiospora rasikravindrae TaxID=990691 RepID=A0ABR1TG48_9PEZI